MSGNLLTGLLLRKGVKLPANRPAASLQILNQMLILLMVGVGLSQAGGALFAGGVQIAWIILQQNIDMRRLRKLFWMHGIVAVM